jgi:hypothetical protein
VLVAQDGNVLAAKKALAEIRSAGNETAAATAAKSFEADHGAKWPKAVAKVIDDIDALLAFSD